MRQISANHMDKNCLIFAVVYRPFKSKCMHRNRDPSHIKPAKCLDLDNKYESHPTATIHCHNLRIVIQDPSRDAREEIDTPTHLARMMLLRLPPHLHMCESLGTAMG